jgi:hypothetical protein
MMAGRSSRELASLATVRCCEPDEIAHAYSQWFPVRSFLSLVAAPQCLHGLGCVAINRIALASCTWWCVTPAAPASGSEPVPLRRAHHQQGPPGH